MNQEDQKLLNYVLDNSYFFPWWREFARNITKQGWISPKQREKLKLFDYERELNNHFRCGNQYKSNNWTAELDHDDILDYTGGEM